MRHEEYSGRRDNTMIVLACGNMKALRGQGAKIRNKNKMQGSHLIQYVFGMLEQKSKVYERKCRILASYVLLTKKIKLESLQRGIIARETKI